MKNITLLFIFFVFSGGLFAQQQVNFVNNSAYDIYISYIVTTDNNDTTGNQQPQLMSSGGGIVAAAGDAYSAVDEVFSTPFKFPYNDFDGIDQWLVPESGSITSNEAYNSGYSEDHKFYFAKVSVDNDSLPVADGGNIGQNFGDAQSFIPGTYVSFFFSAIYPDPSDSNWVIYNILAL